MSHIPYVASLRVFEPIESFDLRTQSKWFETPITTQTKKDETARIIINMIHSDQLNFSYDGVHIIELNGKRFLSPWCLRQRSYYAMKEFQNEFPAYLHRLFTPIDLENLFNKSICTERRVAHALSERWRIPPRWFALFEPDERMINRDQSGVECIFRTELGKAIERCVKSLNIVVNALGNGSTAAEIRELISWLREFDMKSLLELDYGGLASYLDVSLSSNEGKGLSSDTSVEDVISALSSLSRGDGELAGRFYGRLISRWRPVAGIEQAQ